MRRMIRAAGIGGAILTVAACAPRTAPAAVNPGECMAAGEAEGVRTFVVADPPGQAVLGREGFTAACRLPASALARLAGTAPDAAVLYVEGVRMPRERAVTVDVYLGDARTAAGSFTLLPDQGGGGPGRVPVLLGHVLGAALGGTPELRVTLRAVDPANEASPPEALGFDRMVVEIR